MDYTDENIYCVYFFNSWQIKTVWYLKFNERYNYKKNENNSNKKVVFFFF